MTKKAGNSSKQTKGQEGFSRYFNAVYGEERWSELSKSLKLPTRHCLIANSLTSSSPTGLELKKMITTACESGQYSQSSWLANFFPDHALAPLSIKGQELAFPSPHVTEVNEILSHYLLDAASLLPVIALDIQPHQQVLDLCAAPGGKSYLISQILHNLKGTLHSNEQHHARFCRLKGVMKSYNGSDNPTRVTNLDGTLYGQFGSTLYDRVLVDAPCSSERHLVHDSKEMKSWDMKQVATNAQRQLKLLLSAVQLVKPGGRIVYATCALTPEENDGVISKLLARLSHTVQVQEFLPGDSPGDWGESTKHGWLCLPDRTGWGPIYLSILERVVPSSESSDAES